MPQIWLDDEELADFTGLGAADARIYAIQQGWPRMRSRSGLSRSRLPDELTKDYLRMFAQASPARDTMVGSWTALRETLMALVPGSGNMSHRTRREVPGEEARSGHSIDPTVLVSETRQSKVA